MMKRIYLRENQVQKNGENIFWVRVRVWVNEVQKNDGGNKNSRKLGIEKLWREYIFGKKQVQKNGENIFLEYIEIWRA